MMREMHIIEVDPNICITLVVSKLGVAREEANSLYEKSKGFFRIF